MAGADWRGGGVGGTLWVFPEQPVIWWRSVMAKGKK
jgi:hypothetical protein